VGRKNSYEINPTVPLRDTAVENGLLRDLLTLAREPTLAGLFIELLKGGYT
jgi:hypothetical protein